MSGSLAARAELEKLAGLLGTDAADLDGLAVAPAEDLRALREQVTDLLYDADRHRYERIAAAGRLVPVPVVATIAKVAFGPLLCARIAGVLEPRRASDIAGALPADFLAEVCVELDPRRVAAVLPHIRPKLAKEVAGILGERREAATMGRFLPYVSDEVVLAAFDALDAESLLRTGFLVDDPSQLDRVLALLSDDRRRAVVRDAAATGRWPEALAIAAWVGPEQRRALIDAVLDDDGLAAALVEAAQREGLWPDVLPLVAHLDEASRRRIVTEPALHDPAVLAAIVDAAADHDLWDDLLPLVPLLPDAAQRTVASAATALPPEALHRAIRGAHAGGHWNVLLDLAQHLDPEDRDALVGTVVEVDDDIVAGLVRAVGDEGRWADVLAMAAEAAVGSWVRIAERGLAAGVDVLDAVTDAAEKSDMWEPAIDLVAGLPLAAQQRLAGQLGGLAASARKRLATRVAHRRADLGPLGDALD